MPDLEMLITETVERAVRHALSEAISNLPSSQNTISDDEVIGVPALAKYLGIGSRRTYQLVNCEPANFPVKRVGTRILILKGVVRRWLEAGGDAVVEPMRAEVRRSLGQQAAQKRPLARDSR